MKEDARDLQKSGRDEASAPKSSLSLPEDVGLAESFLATGRDAGFDMTSQEGVAAWSTEIKRRIMSGNALEKPVPRAESSVNPPSKSPARPFDRLP